MKKRISPTLATSQRSSATNETAAQDNEIAVGVDFGGTKMLGAAVTPAGEVLVDERVPTPYDPAELLASIVSLVESLEARVKTRAVAVGIGAAGLVDRGGHYRFGPNVGGVRSLDMVTELSVRLGNRFIYVDNDNTCATWGECVLGAGKGVSEALFVGLGTGIGGGIVSDGALFRGANGFSAEFGHMTIVADGTECVCGKRGCWEAYASGRALGRLGREAAMVGTAHRSLELAGAVDDIRGEHVTRAAREGDREARAIMDEFAHWLAIGLANVIAILDPEIAVVGGGMSSESDLYFPQTQDFLANEIFGVGSRPEVPVVVATLGVRAGVTGAALLALHNLHQV